jgi:hypothetical protein
MRRFLATSALLAALAVGTVPAFAGPAEQAFLQKLTNSWTGSGQLKGAQTGPVDCRIVITGGGQAARYQGRCNIPDIAAQAFSGSIVYNDQTKRYEARSFSGTVPGVKRGDSLVFTTKNTQMGGTAYSTMTLSPSSLVVTFTLIDKDGQKTTSTITFKK